MSNAAIRSTSSESVPTESSETLRASPSRAISSSVETPSSSRSTSRPELAPADAGRGTSPAASASTVAPSRGANVPPVHGGVEVAGELHRADGAVRHSTREAVGSSREESSPSPNAGVDVGGELVVSTDADGRASRSMGESYGSSANGSRTPPAADDDVLEGADVVDLVGGYRRSRAVLAAVDLGVFEFSQSPRTRAEIERWAGLHPRSSRFFLDALVGLDLLQRVEDDPATGGRYANTDATARFLVSTSPQFLGVDLIERSRRSYCHWNWLTDALRTGESQVEIGDGLDGAADADPAFCRRGLVFERFASTVELREGSWWSTVTTDAALAVSIATAHPTTTGTVVTTSAAAPGIRAQLVVAGLDERVSIATCDVFVDVLPPVDMCVVDTLLDYSDVERERLLGRVRSTLAAGGSLVVVDDVIDDDRRLNAPALLSALDAVVEGRTCFGYTASEFDGWCRAAGFASTEIAPISGAASAAIAYTSTQ